MKTLTLFALLCAVMALTRAAALPDTVVALPDSEAGNWTNSSAPEEERHVVKRATSCPAGWTHFNSRCFLYVPRAMRWAQAEKNCQSMGGNLASVHSIQEYHAIQGMMMSVTHDQPQAFVGGSNAQEGRYWFWSDGTLFQFSHWCSGEPNNFLSRGQHCLKINHSGQKCWDDVGCWKSLPSVCSRKGW